MLNYVIFTTHSSHLYSMWDFTHTCNPKISPSRVSLPFYGLQDLYVDHEQVLLTPPCLMGFLLHQRVIHGSFVRHSWEPRVNPAHTSMGIPHVHVHGNLASHHYLAPLAIYIFFFLRSLCVGCLGFLYPRWIGIMNTSSPSLHTTMGSNTTFRGGKTPWKASLSN